MKGSTRITCDGENELPDVHGGTVTIYSYAC